MDKSIGYDRVRIELEGTELLLARTETIGRRKDGVRTQQAYQQTVISLTTFHKYVTNTKLKQFEPETARNRA